MPTLNDADRADLARLLRDTIEADRFPLSPRVRRWRELLAKLEPSEIVVEPFPIPKPPGRPSLVLEKRRRR